jgi:hypothetical protein
MECKNGILSYVFVALLFMLQIAGQKKVKRTQKYVKDCVIGKCNSKVKFLWVQKNIVGLIQTPLGKDGDCILSY